MRSAIIDGSISARQATTKADELLRRIE